MIKTLILHAQSHKKKIVAVEAVWNRIKRAQQIIGLVQRPAGYPEFTGLTVVTDFQHPIEIHKSAMKFLRDTGLQYVLYGQCAILRVHAIQAWNVQITV
ncbi:MAG: hypothetical protein Tsb0026_00320 [Sulfuricaulis sp.]